MVYKEHDETLDHRGEAKYNTGCGFKENSTKNKSL